MLSSLAGYSHFVYTIPDRFPSVRRSTLVLKPMGSSIGFGQRVEQAFQPADSLERLSHIRFAPVEKPPTRHRTRKARLAGVAPVAWRFIARQQVQIRGADFSR